MATVLPFRTPLLQPLEVGTVTYFRFVTSCRDRAPRGGGVCVHVPLSLDAHDAHLFLAHLATDALGVMDHSLADRHLLLDHGPLLHRDPLFPQRDADLL